MILVTIVEGERAGENKNSNSKKTNRKGVPMYAVVCIDISLTRQFV